MTQRDPKFTHVAVLMGGWSAEREVSLATGEACADALRRAGFPVTPVDVKRDIAEVLADLRPDVAFNALHGKWGEDGCMAAILETMQIPYTHSGVRASAIAMDKVKSKILFAAAGIPVAESCVVDIEIAATQHPMPVPYVLKPQAQGSSVGVHIVDHNSNGPASMILEERELFGDQVLVERFIPGKELTCAVMGDVALGVIDIQPAIGFYDYRAKYAPGGSVHVLPANIPREIYRKIQEFSLTAHQALGCKGVSRADFRYDDTPGSKGELILLEVNTQPGMTSTSLVPELAAHAGHNFEQLVTWMVNDASVKPVNILLSIRHRALRLCRSLPPQGPSLRVRFIARMGACLLLCGAIIHGLVIGGHLDYAGSPWRKLPGQLASSLGFAADDIRITGLVHQQPDALLSAIAVVPGGSLVGLDAARARALLENLDWVAHATVMRKYPNRLDIVVTERQPFAIWQRDGAHYVIDQTGTAMSTLDPKRLRPLLLVTGEGAHRAVAGLVNELEAVPQVKKHVAAAARVGHRRWTLYLDNGVTIALPEEGAGKALVALARIDRAQGLLSKGIKAVDLRLRGEIIIELQATPDKDVKNFKVSQQQ